MSQDTAVQRQRLQNGSAPQVVLRGQTLLFHGQTCSERAVMLGLLRHLKAQGVTNGHAEPDQGRWTSN